jgi:hypothetical protein
MRVLLPLAMLMAALAGCSSPAARAPHEPSSSPSHAPSTASPSSFEPAGVLMTSDTQRTAAGTLVYHLAVVSATGHVLRRVSAAAPSLAAHLPRFSVAGQDVYFLDGDSDVRVLHNTGTVAAVRRLPGSARDRVIFSVSPDERRLAYSVIHIGPPPTCPPDGPPCNPIVASVELRVGNLDGSGQPELLGSSGEYPVGWLGGRLIVATGGPVFVQNLGEQNPYFASGYRLIDLGGPTEGSSIGGACASPGGALTGPVSKAGTACVRGTTVQRLDWANHSPVTLGDVSPSMQPVAALSPDGARAAVATFGDRGQPDRLKIVTGGKTTDTGFVGLAAGWFDDGSLLYVKYPGAMDAAVAVLDLTNHTSIPVDLGASAGFVDQYAPFFTPLSTTSD